MTLSLLMRIDNKVKTRRITTRQAKAGSKERDLRRAKEGQKEKGGSEKDLSARAVRFYCAREAVLLKTRKPRPRWVEQFLRRSMHQAAWETSWHESTKGKAKAGLEAAFIANR